MPPAPPCHSERVSAAVVCGNGNAPRERVEEPLLNEKWPEHEMMYDNFANAHLQVLLDRMRIMGNPMFVYISASKTGTLYVGVTNGLLRRMREHKELVNPGFTSKYHCNKLVYFEIHDTPSEAIAREKQIKNWRRDKKIFLIRRMNPAWMDLMPLLPQANEDRDERSIF